MNTYLFFDVETPNRNNDRISSMGLIYVKGNKVKFEQELLIDPETSFDTINMKLTGIHPSDLNDAPTFPEIWDKIKPMFQSGLVIIHNANFDLSVLDKTLTYYGLAKDFGPVNYCDTYRKARQLWNAPSYALDNLCGYLGIPFGTHHNSLDDTRGCRDLFEFIAQHYGWSDNDVETKWFGQVRLKADPKTMSEAMNDLKGALDGITFDGIVNTASELDVLYDWQKEYQGYLGYPEFRKINELIDDLQNPNRNVNEILSAIYSIIEQREDHSSSRETKAYNQLKGIIKGIVADGRIEKSELENLQKWMQLYSDLRSRYPFNRLYESIVMVLDDGVLSPEEEIAVMDRFKRFINPVEENKTDHQAIQFEGKICVLSGVFKYGEKSEVAELLSAQGATVAKGVTRKTDYLIVGGDGHKDWAYGNYGTKVKKALDLQSKGFEIKIIGEHELFSYNK